MSCLRQAVNDQLWRIYDGLTFERRALTPMNVARSP